MSFGRSDEYRISLKFFSDEEDLEEDDIYDEEEGVYEDGGMEQEEDVSSSRRTSNPIIDKVRKKAQKRYNESVAKDRINEAGSEAGVKVEKGANTIGDAVGGNIGTAIKAGGQIGKDKLSHVGDTVGNKIGGQGGNEEFAGEEALDRGQEVLAKAGAQAADVAVKTAAASTGVGALFADALGKVAGWFTEKVLKSKWIKYVIIGALILAAGGLLLLLLPVITLFTFGATSLEFITGFFGKFVSAMALFEKIMNVVTFFDLVNQSFWQDMDLEYRTNSIVEQKLKAIYKEEDITDSDTDEVRKADKEYAKDLDTNIPRERMEAYVRTELQCLVKFADTNADGSVGATKDEYNMVDYYSGKAKREDKVETKVDSIELLDYSMGPPRQGASYTTTDASTGGNIDYEAEIKSSIAAKLEGANDVEVEPEGLTEALDNIPTAESFFAPLEESTGNPAIYNGENFTKSITTNNKGWTTIQDAEKIVIKDENGNLIEERMKEDVPEEGDIVTGNPPIFEIISPVIDIDGKTKSGVRRDTEDDDKIKSENKDDVSETFVLDVAKIVRGEDKDIKIPTTVTVQEYKKIDKITDIQDFSGTISYTQVSGGSGSDADRSWTVTEYYVDYTATARTNVTVTTPKAVVAKLELWDRVETYKYKMETKPPVVDGDRITVTTDLVFVTSETKPTGKAQELHDKYQLSSEDFGIYKEITGMDYLCDANEYNMMTAEEYEGAFNNANLATPVANMGTITSNYGYRNLAGVGADFHNGIDFGVSVGTECYSISDGLVQVVSGKNVNTYNGGKGERSYGVYVKVDYGDGITAFYAHLSSTNLKAGDRISKGDVIGLTGNSGFSTGPHLHFEVRKDNKAINPMSLLNSSPKDSSM